MWYFILIAILILISYYIIQNTLGWNGKIVELPAYNSSLIRQHVRKRNAIVIRNFMTEETK